MIPPSQVHVVEGELTAISHWPLWTRVKNESRLAQFCTRYDEHDYWLLVYDNVSSAHLYVGDVRHYQGLRTIAAAQGDQVRAFVGRCAEDLGAVVMEAMM